MGDVPKARAEEAARRSPSLSSSVSSSPTPSQLSEQEQEESLLLARLEEANRALVSDEKAVVHVDHDAGVKETASKPRPEAAHEERQEGSADMISENAGGAANKDGDMSIDSCVDPAHSTLWQWGEVLANWDTFYKKKPRKLLEYSIQGVPSTLRGKVWELMAQSKRQVLSTSLMGFVTSSDTDQPAPYTQLLQQDSPHEKLIRRDIARTFPTHELFAEREGLGQEVLYNVIKAYSLYDPEVGYCQGSPFIVGLLLMHMPEEEAFHLLISLMRDYDLRGLFRPSMADLPLRLYQLECLFEQFYPKLHGHFDQIGVSISAFASQWFLTLFATTLPLPLVFRIIDLFLLEDVTVLFRAGLALLGNNHDYLLRQNMEGVLAFLTKRGPLQERYPEGQEQVLIDALVEIKVPVKRLQKLEKDYAARKAQEAADESELSKLRAQCASLKEQNRILEGQVARLETETGVLAEKLLETSVKLHKREEEVYDLRQVVADMQNITLAWSDGGSTVPEHDTSMDQDLDDSVEQGDAAEERGADETGGGENAAEQAEGEEEGTTSSHEAADA